MTIAVDLKTLLETGAHFGHQARRWNPKMSDYMHGVVDGVHVFDLIKTKQLLEEALAFLETASRDGKVIVFVGTKKQAKEETLAVAKELGCFYVTERWLGGTLTNFEQIRNTLKRLNQLKTDRNEGKFNQFTKKERVILGREMEKTELVSGGLDGMDKLPDVLIVLDIKKESGAVREAKAKGVTVVGLTDSNSDPTMVDYPIPMNDDAKKAIDYVLDLFKQAILAGRKTKAVPKKATKKTIKK